jgi:hypothetical protein
MPKRVPSFRQRWGYEISCHRKSDENIDVFSDCFEGKKTASTIIHLAEFKKMITYRSSKRLWILAHVILVSVFISQALAEDPPPEPADIDVVQEQKGLFIGPLKVGGALRFNYIYSDWDERYKNTGELAFETVIFKLNLDTDELIGSLDYRYYRDKFSDGHDYSMLKHGWLGWKFDDSHEIHAGVHRVPFGILPYASHSWFFQLPFYVGLEDDYDLGLKYKGEICGFDLQMAYYFRDEGHYQGDSDDSSRYAYDLVREGTNGNAERGQVNLRMAYTIEHEEDMTTELGMSFQWGQIANDNTSDHGDHFAIAAHANGTYKQWNIMLQAIRYEYDVKNDPLLDAAADGSVVVMGAYDSSYNVASDATILSAGLAYKVPVGWGDFKSLTIYNDFGVMIKDESGFENTYQNVVGVSIDADPFYIYIDVAMGRRHPWLGGGYTDGLGTGAGNSDWQTRFNVNVGFYF